MKKHTKLYYAVSTLLALLILAAGASAFAQETNPYPAFESALRGDLSSKGLDCDHNAYHFVVLVNRTVQDGPAAEAVQDAVNGLFDHFFVSAAESPNTVDSVSVLPYCNARTMDEIAPGEYNAPWDAPLTPDLAKTLSSLSQSPVIKNDFTSGHDDEHALLHAISMFNDPTRAANAIYIVISDTDKSQTSENLPQASLTKYTAEWDSAAQRFNFLLHPFHTALSTGTTSSGDNTSALYHLTIYVPSTVTPTGPSNRIHFTITPSAPENGKLSPTDAQETKSGGSVSFTATPDSGNVIDQWEVDSQPSKDTLSDGTKITTSGTTLTLSNIGGGHSVGVKFAPPPPDYSLFILGGLVLVCIIAYLVWIYLPRDVYVNKMLVSPSLTQPAYILEDNNVVQTSMKPAGEKIGTITVSPTGQVVIKPLGAYGLLKKNVTEVSRKERTFTFVNRNNERKVFEVIAYRVK